MGKRVFTELELIMYCIEMKVPNESKARKRLSTFLKRNKLDARASYEALIKDVLTIHESVELGKDEQGELLTGQKRIYVLGELREEKAVREYGYVGTQVAKDQDAILKEYVFNRLIDSKSHSNIYPIAIWSDIIEVFNINHLDRQDIRELYEDYYYKNESKRVADTIVSRLIDRNKETVDLAFTQLHKDNRIIKTDMYFSTNDKSSRAITLDEYESIQETIRTELHSHGMDYKTYVWIKKNIGKAKGYHLEVLEHVKDTLLMDYNIDGIYKAYKIEVIDRKKHLLVSKEMMQQAYFEKLVKLTERNVRMKADKVTGFVEKEFMAFNMYLFIHQYLGEIDLEERLMELLPSKDQIEEVQEIHRQYGIEKAKREAERIRNSDTFVIED